MSYNDGADNGIEYTADEVDVAENEAKVIITLTRLDEGIDGFVDVVEGMEFDPGDTDGEPVLDVLRLAAEMVLVAAGYDEEEVAHFLDTAPRGPMQLEDVQSDEPV